MKKIIYCLKSLTHTKREIFHYNYVWGRQFRTLTTSESPKEFATNEFLNHQYKQVEIRMVDESGEVMETIFVD